MTFINKIIGDKKRWRQYRARVEDLPENYRIAIKAIQRYSYYFGGGSDDGGMRMLEDLAELFEQAAANGTPIRDIVGDNPDEFAKEFFANYSQGQWIIRERDRLARDIKRAEETGTGSEGGLR